jgi:hypothetical protein
MRFPKTMKLGIRVPAVPGLRTRSMSHLLNAALGVAYWLMILLTLIVVAAFVVTLFIPMGPTGLIFSDESGGTQIPVSRTYILFGFGAFAGYFGGFALILRQLRRIFSTLATGDPFHPTNVSRLKQIGLTLSIVTGGAWIGQSLVARLARGEMDPPSLFDLVTPAFSVLVVFVLAEVFREGARLRRESELTI